MGVWIFATDLHWRYDTWPHETCERIRVFTDEDIRYGSFDVITVAEFEAIKTSNQYKGNEVNVDVSEYVDEE